MRITVLTIVVLLLFTSAGFAENVGSGFGTLTTAETVGKGQTLFSGALGVGDYTTFGAAVTYGFSDNMDGRAKIGVLDEEFFDTAVVLGADMKFQLWDREAMGSTNPFDLAAGGFVEWMQLDSELLDPVIESTTVFQIGGSIMGSYTSQLSNGQTITPYGRLNLRLENISVDFPPEVLVMGDASNSDLALGLNAGVAWAPSTQVNLFGEFQIDGNDGIFFGIDFRP